MTLSLDGMVPWGRTFEEYRALFRLGDADLEGTILGVGDGPAGFNPELTRRGGRVVSVDPLYCFPASAIRRRIDEVRPEVEARLHASREDYCWAFFEDAEELIAARVAAMEGFLNDLYTDRERGSYVAAALPDLPFAEGAFDLALISHLLFLDTDRLSSEFHMEAVAEAARVAREVRIFPLLDLSGLPSPEVALVWEWFEQRGWTVGVEEVPYELQPGGNRMLRARAAPE